MIQNCYNGCGSEFPMEELIQISNAEGTHLMQVCEECLIEDSSLADWEVDFGEDPRGFDTMKALAELRITF